MNNIETDSALEGVAIIGMAGRFPGASDITTFWRNLCDGIQSLTTFTVDELRTTGIDESLIENPDYVRARPILDNVDLFDAGFFGYQPREAELMDPQHRVFLECAWEALEHAGYAPEQISGLVGVYAGLSLNTYLLANLCANRQIIEELTQSYQVGSFHTLLGNDKDFLPSRVAYKMNLRGPSVNVQSACSTSLVAIAQACQSLLNYQCDIALAGGVSISFPQRRGYLSQEGGMISPNAEIRAFDDGANGTVFGEGVGVITLKRLAEALEDGDSISAVIRGYAINNDGSAKVSYMAPSVEGQAEVIATAIGMSGVDADSISYIEAHGTGTPLGDPIEVAGLTKAFRMTTDRTGFCALGSAKTNIGHLDVAAGVTGVIKTALSLKNRLLPPSLHFEAPNSRIDFANSPFYVNSRLTPWAEGATPRRAGVSSFGVGGTNAHVVMEEAPLPLPTSPSRQLHLLVLSAKTPSALDSMTANLADYLRQSPDVDIADVAYTLQRGRQAHEHRRVLVVKDTTEAVSLLTLPGSRRLLNGARGRQEPAIVFVFPGQGTQQINMGRELYETESVFRDCVDQCCDILEPLLHLDLRRVLYPETDNLAWAEEQLLQTTVTQPALFVMEYALATLWMHWGIRPQAMIGHSLGEYTAACIAGVFTLEDALTLLAERARLMQSVPSGAMLAVRLSATEVRPLLGENLSLAAVNGSTLCVVSGSHDAVQALENQLSEQRVACRRLNTSHAFHSAMMDPVIEPYIAKVRQTPMQAPQIPYISNLTADWIRPEEATNPVYWGRHLREAVRFEEGAKELLRDQTRVYLEVGPGQTLSGLLRQQAEKAQKSRVFASFDPERSDLEATLTALGQLWLQGTNVDWEAFYSQERRRRLSLPTYPFERKRHWVEPVPSEQKRRDLPISVLKESPDIVQEKDSIALNSSNSPSQDMPMTPPVNVRFERIQGRLIELMQKASGVSLEGVDSAANFVELGFDSLFMTQAAQLLQKEFKVRVTFRQLMGDLSSIENLARHLDEAMPPDPPAAPVAVATPAVEKNGHLAPAPQISPAPLTAPALPTTMPTAMPPVSPGIAPTAFTMPALGNTLGSVSPEGLTAFERVAQQQLQAMSQLMALQLEALRGVSGTTAPMLPPVAPNPLQTPSAPQAITSSLMVKPEISKPAPATTIGRFRPVTKGNTGELEAHQQAFLDGLISNYVRRTAESKRQAQLHRSYLADPRTVAGFRSQWKEIVYPIVFERASGTRLYDVDGNEYVDFVNGFGVTMFGHSPDWITEAVEAQIKKGVPIGPQSPLAGEVAKRICELTGMERACFCNTGSEAVMAALRITRTVTGRDKVVVFAGDYHGTFDEVLVRPGQRDGQPIAMPLAPGIPQSMVDNMVVLEYGAPESLTYIEEHAEELAAVLVESVQSRRPELQPREFLQEVRRITKASDTALIFDEIVTGFRVHPGGVQAVFGIRADLATYGKVIGGEYPIGILAGSSVYMDALDGGMWNYGDDSFPEVGMTFHAGTFMRHPQALAATLAVLDHLKAAGPALQEKLNARGDRFALLLNACFERRQVPIQAHNFGSILHLSYESDLKYIGLLYSAMRARGIYLLEGFPIYLTTVHTDEDLEASVRTFDDSIAELQEVNLLPGNIANVSVPETLDKGTKTQAPLTLAQQEIWSAALMGDAANCAFNELTAIRLTGAMDIVAMQTSVNELVRRRDILRCTCSPEGDTLTFVDCLDLPLSVQDLSGADDTERERQLEILLVREGQQPFDLVNGPLIRFGLFRIDSKSHVLCLTVHHIICDGWSTSVLLEELSTLYNGYATYTQVVLEPAPSFCEYANHKALSTRSQDVIEAEEYWLSQFEKIPPILELPTDRPRPSLMSFRGARLYHLLSAELTPQLRKWGARSGHSLFVMLFAAYNSLLYRLTQQTDIVVGVPTAAQALEGMPDLIGHCVNFLPIRTNVSLSSFEILVKEVKETVLTAYEHQDITFGTLIQKLKLPRDSSRVPLITAVFNLETEPSQRTFHQMESVRIATPKSFTQFDLFFNLVETTHGLQVECDYNTDIFETATIQRWISHFECLLKGIVESPEAAVDQLPMMTSQEQSLLLSWNNTTSENPTTQCVQMLFKEQVAKTPDAIAIECDGIHLTYQELNRRAEILANHLYELSVNVDTCVGISVSRSVEMIVGILGILMAGAAYVPLDPDYPMDRLSYMLTDAKVDILVTQEALAHQLPSCKTTILIETVDSKASPSQGRELPKPTANNLAYVIYTSGSTGRPKGVAMRHGALINLIYWQLQQNDVGNVARTLQFASISFDVSFQEIFSTLCGGGTLILASDQARQDPRLLLQLLKDQSVEQLFLPFVALNQLAEVAKERRSVLKSLRAVITAGEQLRITPAIASFFENHPQCTLHNHYGPTESHVVTTYSLSGAVENWPLLPPIGKPIKNAQIYLLDHQLQFVPVGIQGEIYIGGDCLARGYLGQPELTNSKFVPNPFSSQPDARMYRTGDAGRWNIEGNIEFLGRLDQQAKIRGFRVEPGEVEECLCQSPEIKEAAVVVRPDSNGENCLVAYYTSQPNAVVKSSDLRQLIQSKLPAYMIPQYFISLEHLPLTPTGKVDRLALPKPNSSIVKVSSNLSVGDELEKGIVDIWKKVLNIPAVSLNESFFDIGGHSLLAVRIFVQIEKRFGVRLPLRVLFDAPTIAQLAAVIRSEIPENNNSCLVPIQVQGDRRPLFCVHHGEGTILCYKDIARYLGENQPVYGIQFPEMSVEEMQDVKVEELATRYIKEIRSVEPEGPYHICGVSFGGTVAFEMACQLKRLGLEVGFVGLIDTYGPDYFRCYPVEVNERSLVARIPDQIHIFQQLKSNERKDLIKSKWRGTLTRIKQKIGGFEDEEMEGHLPSMLQAIRKANVQAMMKYFPQPYAGRVTLFKATERVDQHQVDPSLWWSGLALDGLDIRKVLGSHHTIFKEPLVRGLAREIHACLEIDD